MEEAAAPVSGEAMDVMTALQHVLKKSLAHNGLARGLRETCKVCCVGARSPTLRGAGQQAPATGLACACTRPPCPGS